MSVDEIAGLGLGSSVTGEGYLFCWATNKFLGSAFRCLSAWGITYRQTIVWRKQGRAALGGLFATDIEFCLVGQRISERSHAHGRRTRGVRVTTSVFDWPVRSHSEKPEEFFALVESLVDGPYAEIFARRTRPGWAVYGNEIDGRDVRDLALGRRHDAAEAEKPARQRDLFAAVAP